MTNKKHIVWSNSRNETTPASMPPIFQPQPTHLAAENSAKRTLGGQKNFVVDTDR